LFRSLCALCEYLSRTNQFRTVDRTETGMLVVEVQRAAGDRLEGIRPKQIKSPHRNRSSLEPKWLRGPQDIKPAGQVMLKTKRGQCSGVGPARRGRDGGPNDDGLAVAQAEGDRIGRTKGEGGARGRRRLGGRCAHAALGPKPRERHGPVRGREPHLLRQVQGTDSTTGLKDGDTRMRITHIGWTETAYPHGLRLVAARPARAGAGARAG
jgi:hypothetical protein